MKHLSTLLSYFSNIYFRTILTCELRYSTRFHSLSFPTNLKPAFLSFLMCTTCPAYLMLVYEQKVLRHIKLISCIKSALINFVWTGFNFSICIVSVGHNAGIISIYIQLNDWILQGVLQEVKRWRRKRGWLAKHKVISRHFGSPDLMIRRKPQWRQSSRGMCK